MTPLDERWLADHPLPPCESDTDKNDRGRVFIVGGSAFVPGALRLTGEASLRAGAGKLQLATVREAALLLGMFVPEAGVIDLPTSPEGELLAAGADQVIEHAASCDALVLGPGMHNAEECTELVRRILRQIPSEVALVLDAAAIAAIADCEREFQAHTGPKVLTPHHGEMAALTGHDIDRVKRNSEAVAREVAQELGAVVALKAGETIIAQPGSDCLHFTGGTPALATGGSGDVLAGIVGGLLARGADPLTAMAHAVWAHGAAGNTLAQDYGGTGLLSRDLLPLLPGVLNQSR